MKQHTKQHCEYIRHQAKQKFDKVRTTWCDLLRWGNPHRATWILSQTPGQRKNQHIVDPTHLLALRSFVAGFLEGNTSASRPWYRVGTRDAERDDDDQAKAWLQHFTSRTLNYLGTSNFYNASGKFYYDYGVVNTGAHYYEELENNFFVHTLMPGSYFVLNNSYGVAVILVREFALNVKAIVDTYGVKDKNGVAKWDNISHNVKKMYQDGNYSQMVDIVHVIQENVDFDINNPDDPENKQWLELTYELGGGSGHFFSEGQEFGESFSVQNKDVFLKRHTRRRKPFVVGKSSEDFEYGEKGPTQDALGLIKSLNKKAIGKDQALEKMLNPALQGPSSLRKSYITHAANSFVPLDNRAVAAKQKLETIFQINPAIGAIIQDVGDMRGLVDKLYFADFLLYLSKNPKTRTATETDAILEEQQRVVGPNLQSLDTTYNIPHLEFVMDYVLHEDPYLQPIPESLRGQALKPEFVSIFAQAQKAADLPAIDRYAAMISQVAQIDHKVLQKFNTDKLADLYEDRLYLPAGLNRPQGEVDATRKQAQQQAAKQQAMETTIPAMAKAAKDASGAMQQNGNQ